MTEEVWTQGQRKRVKAKTWSEKIWPFPLILGGCILRWSQRFIGKDKVIVSLSTDITGPLERYIQNGF